MENGTAVGYDMARMFITDHDFAGKDLTGKGNSCLTGAFMVAHDDGRRQRFPEMEKNTAMDPCSRRSSGVRELKGEKKP